MSADAIEARFLLLESKVFLLEEHAKEEREARLKLEEKNIALEEKNIALEEKNTSLEQLLKKQAKDRETDLVRLTATNNQLKAQLRDSEAREQALDLKIQQEADARKAGDLALIWNVGLPRDYSKVNDKPDSRFGSQGAGNGQFQFPDAVACNCAI